MFLPVYLFLWEKNLPRNKYVVPGLNVVSFVFQLTALLVWPIANTGWKNEDYFIEDSWALPVGLFLASFGYWESFVREESITR